MKNKTDIYIIGGGVSGLISAYELEQNGYHPIIIEQTNQVGGRVKTVYEKGYPLDIGFQVMLSAYPLVNKYLDTNALKLRKLEPGALIYVEDKVYQIGDPLRNWKLLLPTLFANVGSISDKLKILKLNNLLKHKSTQDIFNSQETTTHQYLIQFGFSPKIIERFFKPFFSGIFLESNLKTSSRMFEFVYKMFGDGYATIPMLGIGEISKQLKNKLRHTEFIFNNTVKEISTKHISMSSGEIKNHDGVILANNSTSLIKNFSKKEIKWKSCLCFYFEVDQTNIPINTIALVSDPRSYSNNLFAYTDAQTGKLILSVTTLELDNNPDKEIINQVVSEVKKYTGALKVIHIHHFSIKQALPDIQNLKMTIPPSECQVDDNIFLAGDSLLNGSLNAALESGRLAAQALIEKKNLCKN